MLRFLVPLTCAAMARLASAETVRSSAFATAFSCSSSAGGTRVVRTTAHALCIRGAAHRTHYGTRGGVCLICVRESPVVGKSRRRRKPPPEPVRHAAGSAEAIAIVRLFVEQERRAPIVLVEPRR